jgi:hypothetical protein
MIRRARLRSGLDTRRSSGHRTASQGASAGRFQKACVCRISGCVRRTRSDTTIRFAGLRSKGTTGGSQDRCRSACATRCNESRETRAATDHEQPGHGKADPVLPRSASKGGEFLQLEGLAFARTWGFESPLSHQPSLVIRCEGCLAVAAQPRRRTSPLTPSQRKSYGWQASNPSLMNAP